MSQTLEIELSS